MLMPRTFVIEGEPLAVMPDVHEPALEADPFHRPGLSHMAGGRRQVSRTRRIHRQGMLDVHEQQFLVLLLMMNAELDHSVPRRFPF